MRIDPSRLPYRPCVGIMVLNRRGDVWVGRRTGAPIQSAARGWWQMPQGGIDEGETPETAAMRELLEETGMRSGAIIGESRDWHPYDLPPDLLGKVWGGRYRGQRQKWFAVRFTGEDSEIDISPVDHEAEFEDWRWAPYDDVLSLIVPFKRDVYATILAEFRQLAVAIAKG